PHEELMPAARDLARRLAASAPLSVPLAKRAVYRGLSQTLEENFEYMAMVIARLRQSEDHLEWLAASRERREPNFQGR
ncbi:MAG TPA: hypothetical protein VHL09_14620, partial [Dehalococcoidia bacterium]|nr:hypothetical protein [Dehalococcoidia bacterium]